MKTEIQEKYSIKEQIGRLEEYFFNLKGVIIAYSGGVDSALLAYVAHLVLQNRMKAVIADSPSLARREYLAASSFARQHGIPLQTVKTGEVDNPQYQANQGDRCYFCKKSLFEKLFELREQLSLLSEGESWPIAYGVNIDDLGDHRPGIQAADEAEILAPYLELGFDKNTIRQIGSHFDLTIADKPAMPCIASRISYGEPVSAEKLSQVERAEDFLSDLGFHIFRVRHHGDIARIEVPPDDFDSLLKHREQIIAKLQELGFMYVSMDLNGFKSGSLNAVLK